MDDRAPDPGPATPTNNLLYRWFVEYNPFYLLSAMLVLGGTILSSRGLAHEESVYGGLGVAAIAELYSAALVFGAALLARVGQRRSAVMLALLTVVYQADLTLHTETCPNLGGVGVLASGVWLALFVAKLFALAWALRLRPSRAAIATATLGAAGLAVFPYALSRLDARSAGALVAVWLFALTALQRSASVAAIDALDDWGRTVLRRALRATWLLWALLGGLHVVFWSTQYHLDVASLAPIAPLVAVRWIRRESRVWCAVAASFVLAVTAMPASFSAAALVAAAALALRAWRASQAVAGAPSEPRAVPPYRAFATDERPAPSPPPLLVMPSGPAAARRLLTGAGFALYLSAWTVSWSGGAWPAHAVTLDAALTAAALIAAWKGRARGGLAPAAGAWAHFAFASRLVAAPTSLLGWGGASIGVGFALLLGSLGTSIWIARRRSQPV